MRVNPRSLNNWLLDAVLLLILLYFGRPLLVPLAFSLLLWGILNALVEFLQRMHFPKWLGWTASFLLIGVSLYFIVRILTSEASALANQVPSYAARLQNIWSSHGALKRLLPALNFEAILQETNGMAVLSQAVGSVGRMLANLVLMLVLTGFLLHEQRYLPGKLARFQQGDLGAETEKLVHMIGSRIQSYLGVCTMLSIVMAMVTYALLAIVGLDFAGFWALVMFFLTYIPVVGAFGAILPALMALLQFGTVGQALVIALVLGGAHFILTDVIETIMLGNSFDISPFVIMVALTFWGLIWGIPGLFLAVPLTSAIAITCRQFEGLEWIPDLIAGPPRRRHSLGKWFAEMRRRS